MSGYLHSFSMIIGDIDMLNSKLVHLVKKRKCIITKFITNSWYSY